MEPCVSGLNHVPCTEVANALANSVVAVFNPLNTELNPICHLLALLGTHHILHISRIRVNIGGIWELTFTYRCLGGFVTGCGPGWMLDKLLRV